MKRTLNKSKLPYLLFLVLCMVAASIKLEVKNEPNPNLPLKVSVQTPKQTDELTPPADWIVELILVEENQ